jgi:hypothetical protein
MLSIAASPEGTSTAASVVRWLGPIEFPIYILALLAMAIAALPWVKWSKRFSLRAFLIIVTLFAALLAAIVRAIK